MEFTSKEEMLAFEKERTEYYMEFLNAKNIFQLYKLEFRDLLIPKYRKLKKKYDGYYGGYYRDIDGIIHAEYIEIIDIDNLEYGTICIDSSNKIWIFNNHRWIHIAPEIPYINNIDL